MLKAKRNLIRRPMHTIYYGIKKLPPFVDHGFVPSKLMNELL
jgi:hypothetical protein